MPGEWTPRRTALRGVVAEPPPFCSYPGTQTVKPEPGTYALILLSTKQGVIRIGRLGRLRLQPGFYVYVGSALGPGGVRARVAHHQRVSPRPRWHIDYLRARTRLVEVWCCYDRVQREHQWASALELVPGAGIPLARFGASDCHCASHLYFFHATSEVASASSYIATTFSGGTSAWMLCTAQST